MDTTKAKFIKYFNDKTVIFNNQIITVCCSLGNMVANTVRLAASEFSKINRPIFFRLQTVWSCKTQVTAKENLAHRLRYDLVQLKGKLMLFNIIVKKVR